MKQGLPNIAPNQPCYGINSANVEYYEFSCLYPNTLGPFYFSFEKYYDPMPVLYYMQQHPSIPIITCLLYVIFIFSGQYYFQNRKPLNYRYTMAIWNIVLSTFSTIGMIRTLPQLIHNLVTLSLHENVCLDPRATYGSGSSGLWIQLFILILLYCWHSYVTKSPPGIFFVVMNYSVHASMYLYYAIMALHIRPKWFNPMIITSFQISQMIVGIIVTCIAFYYYQMDRQNCGIEAENNIAAFIMYGSYLFLFVQFFFGRYNNNNNHTSHPKKHYNTTNNNIIKSDKKQKMKTT